MKSLLPSEQVAQRGVYVLEAEAETGIEQLLRHCSLPFEQRKDLMFGHGKLGREFAGRILQLITGSVGLDDYEWGVTLFAEDPVDLKECVYQMRFDEASALYAEFGPFVTGLLGSVEEILDRVGVS